MKVGTVSETIQVKGDSPLIETKSAVQSVSVTGETVQALPLGPQKHWSEFIRFTPGAISSDATNNQAPVFYIHGAGIVSESTLMDGADMTSAINPWLGYTGLPTDTVADVQLKTSGLDAAAPLGMGLAANVITKSGTNAFHGSGTYTSAPGSWVGNNVTGGTASSAGINQPEFAVGGPIVADKAWFFGSYRYRGGFLGINRPASQVTAMQALSPGFVPFNNEFNNANILFVKMDAKLSPFTSSRASSTATRRRTAATARSTPAIRPDEHWREGFSARLTSAWNNWIATRLAFSWNNKSALTSMVTRPRRRERLPDRRGVGRTARRHDAAAPTRTSRAHGIALHKVDDHRRCDDVPRPGTRFKPACSCSRTWSARTSSPTRTMATPSRNSPWRIRTIPPEGFCRSMNGFTRPGPGARSRPFLGQCGLRPGRLAAHAASDGQWRHPPGSRLPVRRSVQRAAAEQLGGGATAWPELPGDHGRAQLGACLLDAPGRRREHQ